MAVAAHDRVCWAHFVTNVTYGATELGKIALVELAEDETHGARALVLVAAQGLLKKRLTNSLRACRNAEERASSEVLVDLA